MLPTSTATSVTLHVEELCQPGVTGINELEIIGGFVERGAHSKTNRLLYLQHVFQT